MRKKLTMLLISLFLVQGTVWAQVAYTVDATTGSGVTSNGWSKNWSYTTTAEKPAALNLLCNAANMQTRDNLLALYVGTTSPATYTLQVPNKYHIVSYSFDFVKDGEYTNDVTLTVDGKEYKPTSETQTVSVENVNASSTSFVFSGANKGITVSNFVVNIVVAPIELTTDENNPKWYTIKNIRGNAYARYDGDGEAIKLYGDIVDRAFLFYFTVGTTEGTYKIHNAANDLLCAGTNSWTADGAEWYIKASGNTSYPGFAISTNADLTKDEAWNDHQNAHTSVALFNGNDAGSTWDIVRYEGEVPAIQLSTEGNIVLYYIRSIRRDSYVNFDGHNSTFKEGAQGLASYWYFVQDTEAQDVPEGFIACKIFNAAHATGVENHSSGFMGTDSWPARTYYIGTSEHNRYGYLIYRSDANLENNGYGCWHDSQGNNIMDYHKNDDGSLWRIYPAGKTGAELMSEATTAKNNALTSIALYESADYYTYSNEAIATAKSAIEAINTAELHSAVAGLTSIPAALATLQETEKGTAGPAAGDYIRFMNRAKGVYMAATENDGDMIRKSDDATDLKTLWLVEAGENGSVKLKNVGTQKYIGAIAQSADVKQKESAEASQFTFTNVADVYGAFQTTGGGVYTFANMNEWWGTFKLVGWEKNDAASQWVMTQAYPLTVVYQFEGAELTDLRVEKVVEPGTVYTIENSDAFDGKIIKSVVGATDNGDGTWAVTVNAATTVTVTLGYEDTNLYALKSPTGTYFNFTAVVPEPGAAMTYASFQEEPSFLYKVAENNSYYFESMSTPGEYIGVGPSNAYWIVAKDNKALWNISAEDANGYVTISRSTNANERLGHDGNTNAGTGVFTNVGNTCFGWQLVPAYPITIMYKNSNDEVLETVKAATIAGTGYSFTVDTKGGTLVSCVADKGTMTETDGTYSFATVNGATTVTVTLEEPEVPVVFNPTPGKAYALKVKDQELYLNVRTLGIDDPNTSGSNNISLSARPFAEVYFEAGSTEGTWKMKNVNGKYVGASGWNPVICDAPHDWTIVLENGVVTIAKAAGAFVNANDGQVAAGNPLYCDKGTPLQFELFDYDDVNFVTGTGTRNGDNGVGGQGTIQVKEIHEEGLTKIPLGAGWRLTMEVENPDGVSYNKFGSSLLAVGSNAFPEKQGYKGFQLYLQSATNGGGKLDAVFGGGDHFIDNVTYQGDFSLVVEYDGSSKITFTTVNAQGNEATNVLSGSLPEIDVFSYGLPTGINIKSAAIQVFDIMYTFHVGTTPEGEDITVTYDGETFAADRIFYGNELDLLKFAATEVPGYSWAVVADKAANTLTLNYTQAEVADLQAVKDLVNRIGGEGTADKFMFVHTPWLNSKQETFVLGAQDGKIRIEGSTISAITTGIGWYLNNVAHINIAWNSLNEKTVAVKENGAAYADLSNLPLPSQTETHTSDAKYRYYLNTCTFGYSMTSWTWTRWQQEIDWMALHGINMPLQLVGLEEVWRTFLIKCGYSETDAKAFVAGPAFIAWWAMNNLQGWGGTDPGTKSGGTWAGAGGVQDDAWYARQTKLAKQIVEAQRGLGMQPVLPGWSGMVPTNFASKSTGKYATRGNGGNWAGDFVRPLLLNTNIGADKYAEIAADYYECLHAVMGESQYYSMDPFHEGGGAGTMEDYQYMYAAMEAAKPGSQWVIQQWQWSATQKYSLTAVPEGRLIVLDLFSDGSPAFDGYNGYAPQEAVFCAIPNFGGRSGLMGRLQNVTDNYFKFKGKYASIKGIGTAPEAIEQTPVTYDLIYQLPWMNGVKPDVAAWVDNYAVARYGKNNSVVKEAWSLLRQGPLNYGADGIQGPVEDVWAARPNLNANAASYWGKTLNNGTASNTYTKERRQMLIDAVYKLISQKDILNLKEGSIYESNYMYDLVEFGGAVMADYAYDLLLGIRDAKNAGNTALYEARRDAFLQLILDMDAFRGTNLNFRLGKWTQEARAAAAEVEGATTATPDWYEYNNARTILSTWSSPNTNLTDYSYRSWQGLLKDYYYPRWKHYFDNNCTGAEYGYFEWNWAHGMKHEVGQTAVSNVPLAPGEAGHTDSYTREPEGNTIEKAVEMLRKYIVPIHMNDGTIYYVYRTFTYDLTDKVTVNVAADATVDFTHYFDIPGDATITGDFINNVEKSAPVNAVPVKPEEAVYTATITLADGTKLENFTVHTPSFNGVYKVSLVTDWGNTPVFIQYNENDNVAGYKMVATSNGYSTDSELDKWFSIAHSGDGYTISAQGKYLKTPLVWEYVLFSENAEEAGTYLFDDSDTHDIYKIVNVDGYHLQAWSYVMALEPGNNTPSTFAFEKVEAYPITIPTDSFTTVYLPFNVLLPAGVEAYDVCGNELVNDSKDHAQGALEKIANSGDVLKAGTPAVLKGAPGSHELEIVMSSNKAKAGLPYSALRGSYEKHTLVHTDDIKKFVLHGTHFDDLQTYYTTVLNNQEGEAVVKMAANTCWLEANIETNQIGLNEGSFVKIEDWLFQYEAATNGIKLTNAAVSGDGELVIPSEVTINGEPKNVVAISPDFLHGNTELTSITLPATLVNLGFREVVPMFEASYEGQEGDGATYEEGTTTVLTQQGMNRCCVFPVDPDTGKPFVISKDFAWKLTLDVTIDADNLSYNKWGSAIVFTKENSLDDHYNGYMQIYMWKDLQHIVVKIDNADDRYSYSTQALDENGDVIKKDDGSDSLLVNRHFRFELEHDGTGGYQVVIYYDNGKAKMYSISASENNKVGDFDRLYYSLPEGIHVNVKFDKLISQGLFVGCTNLHEIIVDENNPTFKSCEHGVLYDKNGYYVMRIPEGETTHHFEIPSKVVRIYAGAVHGVSADIVLHSNPLIGVVPGHEHDVENAKFYLSLEDVDPDPTVGGARDFISANLNHYQKARYKRAPLEKGKYGTIMLPFAPTNAMDKYDFFKLTDADATSLHFSPVDEIEAQIPYLYKLKENPGEMLMEDGKDVFETTEEFTVKYYDKYDPTQEELGSFRALGAYVNHYIETVNYPKSSYYYYSISQAKFLKVTNKLTYRPYRVLFVVTPEEGQAAQAPARLNLRIRKSDGTSTEVDPAQIEGWEEDVYYDLQGRRVENPTQGIYIVNGRKVVIE